jgi:hypothetical protein
VLKENKSEKKQHDAQKRRKMKENRKIEEEKKKDVINAIEEQIETKVTTERERNMIEPEPMENVVAEEKRAKEALLSSPNDNSDESGNSQTYVGYIMKRKEDINYKNDILVESDAKSNEEMKSNSSNHSKISIDNMKIDEQNLPFDDKEDRNKLTYENTAHEQKRRNKETSKKVKRNKAYCINIYKNKRKKGITNEAETKYRTN